MQKYGHPIHNYINAAEWDWSVKRLNNIHLDSRPEASGLPHQLLNWLANDETVNTVAACFYELISSALTLTA